MSKIPCGGFNLDENFLGMNENDELSLVGGSEGKAYQYVVTDEDGNTQWEDRLAYDGNRVVVEVQYDDDPPSSVFYVKVADEIPEWMLVEGTQVKVWVSNAPDAPTTSNVSFNSELGLFINNMALFLAVERETTCPILEDNMFSGIHFPEKGVYFEKGELASVVGIAPASSGTPEITWDGNIKFTKTIDSKYIPSELNGIIIPSSTPGSSKKFKITVDDSGTISATEVTT